MSKGCYTCRRRRIICDNGLPTCRKCRDAGKECLGYLKPLVWVKGGVASRGKMMGRSFGDVKQEAPDAREHHAGLIQSATAAASLPGGVDSSLSNNPQYPPGSDDVASAQNTSRGTIAPANSVLPTPSVLVDPLFQDCSRLSRFYINHCTLIALSPLSCLI